MRAVNSGNEYHIYDNSVQLHNGLPAQIYGIRFDPMQGFSLYRHSDIEVSEKVYGVHESKVAKVMRGFKSFQRSLGVILSGDKGIGKSLFAKMLCAKAVADGYPVIVCDACYPGIANFIDSIDQELVVLFDEFDKTFKSSNDSDKPDAQAAMLSLFDGVSMNKKLFCVTCNDLGKLNNFLVNRPGRFHYHFRFEYPTNEEIEIYMRDHLPQEKYGEIDKITDFARKVELNYDCLRAIAYELTLCDSFEDAVADLNILKPDRGQRCTFFLLFDDGTKMREEATCDLFDTEEDGIWFGDRSEADDDYIDVDFIPSDAQYSIEHGAYYLPVKSLTVSDTVDSMSEDKWPMRDHGDFIRAHRASNVVGMMIKPIFDRKAMHYFKV